MTDPLTAFSSRGVRFYNRTEMAVVEGKEEKTAVQSDSSRP